MSTWTRGFPAFRTSSTGWKSWQQRRPILKPFSPLKRRSGKSSMNWKATPRRWDAGKPDFLFDGRPDNRRSRFRLGGDRLRHPGQSGVRRQLGQLCRGGPGHHHRAHLPAAGAHCPGGCPRGRHPAGRPPFAENESPGRFQIPRPVQRLEPTQSPGAGRAEAGSAPG